MNYKDNKAFHDWEDGVYFDGDRRPTPTLKEAWQAACEYKDKECSNLMDAMTNTSQYNAKLQAENTALRANINGTRMKQMNDEIEKLKYQNALMKEAMEFVLGHDGDFLSTSAEIRLNAAKCIVEKVLQEIDKK